MKLFPKPRNEIRNNEKDHFLMEVVFFFCGRVKKGVAFLFLITEIKRKGGLIRIGFSDDDTAIKGDGIGRSV